MEEAIKHDHTFKGISDLQKHRDWYTKFKDNYDPYENFSPKDMYQIRLMMKNEGIDCKKYNYSLDKQC